MHAHSQTHTDIQTRSRAGETTDMHASRPIHWTHYVPISPVLQGMGLDPGRPILQWFRVCDIAGARCSIALKGSSCLMGFLYDADKKRPPPPLPRDSDQHSHTHSHSNTHTHSHSNTHSHTHLYTHRNIDYMCPLLWRGREAIWFHMKNSYVIAREG